MPNQYVAPWTVVTLFVVRVVELERRKSSYRGTVVCWYTLPLMVVAGFAVVGLSFVEWFGWRPQPRWTWYALGLAVSVGGFALRAAAARALGNLWSKQIEIRPGHKVVTSGPYRWIRHPIYVSLLMEIVGGIVIMQAWWALITALVLYVPILIWRTRREEQAMVEALGENYRAYMQAVPAVVPRPWRHHP